MGPLHDPVTWYQIKYTGEQVAQWDFQNKGRSRWTGTSCIVLEVPLRNLLTSIYNFVPCDWVVQRAHLIVISQTLGDTWSDPTRRLPQGTVRWEILGTRLEWDDIKILKRVTGVPLLSKNIFMHYLSFFSKRKKMYADWSKYGVYFGKVSVCSWGQMIDLKKFSFLWCLLVVDAAILALLRRNPLGTYLWWRSFWLCCDFHWSRELFYSILILWLADLEWPSINRHDFRVKMSINHVA